MALKSESPAVSPLEVDVVYRDHGSVAEGMNLMWTAFLLFRLYEPPQGWMGLIFVFVVTVVVMTFFANRTHKLGRQLLRVDGVVAFIGSRYGFSRLEAHAWAVQGTRVTVHVRGARWTLVAKPGEERSLELALGSVIGAGMMAGKLTPTRTVCTNGAVAALVAAGAGTYLEWRVLLFAAAACALLACIGTVYASYQVAG
jgi:hypothetical protein